MANRWTLNEEHLNVDKYLKARANLYGYVRRGSSSSSITDITKIR